MELNITRRITLEELNNLKPIPFREIKEEPCCVCGDIPEEDFLECKHAICTNCLEHLGRPKCPICRAPVEGKRIPEEILLKLTLNEIRTKEIADGKEATVALLIEQYEEEYGVPPTPELIYQWSQD